MAPRTATIPQWQSTKIGGVCDIHTKVKRGLYCILLYAQLNTPRHGEALHAHEARTARRSWLCLRTMVTCLQVTWRLSALALYFEWRVLLPSSYSYYFELRLRVRLLVDSTPADPLAFVALPLLPRFRDLHTSRVTDGLVPAPTAKPVLRHPLGNIREHISVARHLQYALPDESQQCIDDLVFVAFRSELHPRGRDAIPLPEFALCQHFVASHCADADGASHDQLQQLFVVDS
mmetsp:Transcript_17293/g.47899  ORF Transcript_17293/g.47899 Transcript_17293/m.47899 type:complete len:233 (+) Transcript_17293:1354-2052(+)